MLHSMTPARHGNVANDLHQLRVTRSRNAAHLPCAWRTDASVKSGKHGASCCSPAGKRDCNAEAWERSRAAGDRARANACLALLGGQAKTLTCEKSRHEDGTFDGRTGGTGDATWRRCFRSLRSTKLTVRLGEKLPEPVLSGVDRDATAGALHLPARPATTQASGQNGTGYPYPRWGKDGTPCPHVHVPHVKSQRELVACEKSEATGD